MTIAEFLAMMQRQGIKLQVEGERLRFRGPTGTLTPELRAAITARKDELIALLQQVGLADQSGPRPVARDVPPPLSFAQQRLWFMDQLQPNSAAYNIHSMVTLSGDLDVARLERSFTALVARQESLRTTFGVHAGEPFQQILPAMPVSIPTRDLQSLSKDEQLSAARQIALTEASMPFDLAHGPLLRALLLQLGSDEYILIFTLHHIIADGWSMGVLIRELAHLYRANDEPTALPPLPIQYADYAVWQREQLQGARLESLLDYWQQELEGAPAFIDLPTDRPRLPFQSFVGATAQALLDPELTTALRSLSQRSGATLFMTLLTAFQIMLARYSGQEDIVVGTPIAGRTHSEVEELIGFFVNTLPLRARLSGNPTAAELLDRVRTTAMSAFAHQDLPFEQLIDRLHPVRDLSRQPLLQVVFALQSPLPELEVPGLVLRPLPFNTPFAKFDLTLTVNEQQSGLCMELEYNTDLFESATAERMLRYVEVVARGMTANPHQRIADLPLLPAAEHQQMIYDWNKTERQYQRDVCIHHLFEQQVDRDPGAIAVSFDGALMSYGELNSLSNELAYQLRSLGIGSGSIVAVYMERNPQMIAAVLGILKAGATYVPLELSFPQARIAWILERLNVSCVVTQHSQLHRVEALHDLPALQHAICLDPEPVAAARPEAARLRVWDRSDLARWPQQNLALPGNPNALAYIIFTSGSTGTPKGVMVEHQPVINLIEWVNRTYEVAPSDQVLFITSLCFDLSVYDVFGILAAGGTVRVVSDRDVRDPERLLHIMCSEPITFWDSAPAALQQLAPLFPALANNSGIDTLRLVFLSGDWIPVPLPDAIRQTFRNAAVIALGGATEATVWSNYYPIGTVDLSWPSIPYGKPIQNARYYILDSRLRPRPIGAAGDLYIGGECLASGYAVEPALTAEKFIPDPFSQRPGMRLYRTGDQASFRQDGTMIFLGRLDHQVKIRGFRIEIGEIESVLRQHPGIRELVVVTREDLPGDKRLVAYVVGEQANKGTKEQENQEPRTKNQEPRENQSLPSPTAQEREGAPATVGQGLGVRASTEDLRRYLQERLPEYMVPSAFVFMEALPVTSNGKLDRAQLPAPHSVQIERDDAFVAPRTPTEAALAQIWSAVLGIAELSIHDNFFALGGHSLLATQIISRVREAFQVDLPLRTLFEAATIAELAQRIPAVPDAATEQLPPEMRPVPRDRPQPLSFAQQRLWFLDQLQPGNAFYNMFVAVTLTGRLDTTILEQSLNVVVARHEALRTVFVLADGAPAQVIVPSLSIPFSIVDLRMVPADQHEAQSQMLVAEEAHQPFDLQSGPLLRAKLLRLTEDQHIVVLTMHHIVSDGWSLGVLIQELTALYTMYALTPVEQRDAVPTRLPALPIQYVDFAVWQREWIQGPLLDRQLSYWESQLANLPVLNLPTDRPRLPVPSFKGATETFKLPKALTAALLELSRREDATLFMTLLAGFQLLLARYSGQTDIVVGSPIANRTRAEIEGLIGFFVNMLVLRSDLSTLPTVRQLLSQVRDVCLSAYAHQDLPFEYLVEALQPDRSLSYNPLFQVGFALQNAPQERLEMPELSLQPLVVAGSTSKFDLSLFMHEEPDGVAGLLEYNTDLFDAATIRRLIDHFHTVLSGMVADPEQPVFTLPLLTEPERRQLLVTWNETTLSWGSWQSVTELLEAQALRTPDATALIFGEQQLSYAVLNRRANQLAHHLRSLNVGSEMRVGLYVERSPDLVVGLLGILKAGAAYVPLDPEYPAERLAWMLHDSQAPVIVTQQHLGAQLPAGDARLVCIDADWTAIAAWPEERPDIVVKPDDLAYVIYTSGSTGQPKGVLVEHGQLKNTLSASQASFQFTARDRMPCIASFAFDIAIFELFCPLLAGGSAVLLTKQQILDLPGLARTLQSITVLHTLPSLMRQIAGFIRDNDLHDRYASMRQIFVGGDAVAPDLLAEIHDAFPGARINILYGPTEATIICATHPVARHNILNKHLIGTPLGNTMLRLYDQHRQLVPIGVTGELYIGGASVTRGYLHQQALTDEKFVWLDGQRWYRSGDLARYLPNGTLEFLGRIDQQVKLRGFRIELGEIEAVLGEHAAVRDALVLSRSTPAGDPCLVAYVVPSSAAGVTAAAQEAQIDTWQMLYNETYVQGAAVDPTFNIVGWQSSYTQQSFAADEMREWRDATVSRIRALQPRRVLEIGCGTGLLLFPLSETCVSYHGVDFSPPALEHIRRHLPSDWTHVTLAQRRADEPVDLPPGSVDTVILNSVVQYFPSAEYLVAVLTSAIATVAPGGHVFVGDVRSRPLLPAFAAAVVLAQAPHDTPRQTLLRQVQQQVVQERELLLDPAFFSALQRHLPQISDVEIEIKRGHAHNELTQFRYDVTLTIDGPAAPRQFSAVHDWNSERWTLDDLYFALRDQSVRTLLVRHIPNRRLQPLVQALALLDDPSGPETAAALQLHLKSNPARSVDPETIWAMGAELGYQAHIGWSDDGATGMYDVVFDRDGAARLPVPSCPALQPWSDYATAPAAANMHVELAPQLRQYLQTRLPEYMIPAALVMLDTLPLTANGKVDRSKLPEPIWTSASGISSDAAPVTPLEVLLADIWQHVLGLPAVSVHDNFFALGGHSLLATQVVSRIRSALGIDLPVRTLFENPTIAALSEAVLAAQTAAQATPALPPLLPGASSTAVPLSFAQQRLWFIDQLQPGTSSYNVAGAWQVAGKLRLDVLQASLDTVVARHGSLRTTFSLVDQQPVQSIATQQPLPIALIDLTSAATSNQTAEIRRCVEIEAGRPFDLAQGPLLRVVLLKLQPEQHILLLTMHHIITDGWSMGILIKELADLYAAALQGQPTRLPELPIQYTDYALWQRAWLQGDILEQQLDYWRHQLAGVRSLQLPTDHQRPPVQSHQGATISFALDSTLVEQLQAVGRQTETTLFMVLLTAWKVLMARYSGQKDIAVGTPLAGRTQPELEPLIGFFVNTLVLRTDLAGNPTFRELLARVRTTTLDAHAHQDAPFEAVVEALQPERDLSRQPLFQVMFALANTPMPDIDLPDVQITPLDGSSTAALFDLTLNLFETASGLTGQLQFASDLFDAATIERLVGHFQLMLSAIVAQLDQRIETVPLLTDAETHQLLYAWNDTRRSYPQERCVHELVAAQARSTPEAIALVYGTERITYAELERRSNQLAHRLQALGVGGEVLVGMCLDRSVNLVIGMLAILKAGGAYVPLDPSYPQDRLAFMVQDTRTPVILTEERFLALLPEHSAHTLCLDTAWDRIAQEPDTAPSSNVTAESLAYVMYTSGSTGQPKGTAIPHQAIVRLICNTDYIHLTPEDRVAQASNTAFDAATFEIWGALISGAQLVGIPKEIALAPDQFAALLREQAITTLWMTSAWFNQVVGLAPDAFRSLRHVLFGGEAGDPQHVRAVLHHHPPLRLLNMYGPTESTTFASWYEVRDVPPGATTVPIGRPIANTTLYLLDPQLQPVPIGVEGELYIGGDGLARGYFGRPQLTAEKFVPNPFGAPGSRLYRTGDLARYRADGAIDFVGRIDEQVKLRGFRIELGEIEAVLSQHPQIQAAIVQVVEHDPGDKRLVAYVVPGDAPHPTSQDLRGLIERQLPAYMVPAAFVLLDRLPLTANGKVDRQALPRPEWSRADDSTPFVAPRTPLEEQIAEVWSAILGVHPIGVDDSFFALGGHSLLATQLITQVRAMFQVDIPLQDFFTKPTIAQLAQHVQVAQWVIESSAAAYNSVMLDEAEGDL